MIRMTLPVLIFSFICCFILSKKKFCCTKRASPVSSFHFQTALEEEVTNKVHQLNDIVSGQPLVIKMIVSYYRTKGLLTELLGTLALTLLIS